MDEEELELLRNFDPWKGRYREFLRFFNRKRYIVRSYGLCYWEKVVFIGRAGREMYCLERDMEAFNSIGDKDTERQEFFYGKLIRSYKGPRNCFVEYCILLTSVCRRFPKPAILHYVGRYLQIDNEVLTSYQRYFKRFFL